jgi:hypothetical protein
MPKLASFDRPKHTLVFDVVDCLLYGPPIRITGLVLPLNAGHLLRDVGALAYRLQPPFGSPSSFFRGHILKLINSTQ